jgi:hypothetical protein
MTEVNYRDMYEAINEFRQEVNQSFMSLVNKIDESYVSKKEFLPVKAIVYGLAGIIMISFINNIFKLIQLHF